MNKNTQLELAKKLAVDFLYLPIEETRFGALAIMHPFFESPFLYDGKTVFNALEDEEKYRKYLADFEKNCIRDCDSIEGLVFHVRKSYRLTYLSFLQQRKIVTKKECGNLLADNWQSIENICNDTNVRKSRILSWAKAADKTRLMEKEEIRAFESLPSVVTVYRGVGNKKAIKGMSWTLSEEKARWFARRFSANGGFTYRATIAKENIICYFKGLGEEEIVVDYLKLENVKQI